MDFFLESLRAAGHKHGERLHQDIAEMNEETARQRQLEASN